MSKRQQVVEVLKNAGTAGMTAKEIAAAVKINNHTTVYPHICRLRKTTPIETRGDRYFYVPGGVVQSTARRGRGRPAVPQVLPKIMGGNTNSPAVIPPKSDLNDILSSEEKELLGMMDSEERDTYLELRRKQQFFTGCCKSMLDAERQKLKAINFFKRASHAS